MGDPRSPNTLPSPFRTIAESEMLDQNVFSIKLPQNKSEVGDIVFGGSNEDLLDAESLVYHPLYPTNTTLWQVEISGVSLVKADEQQEIMMNTSTESHSALLMTSTPLLMFPQSLSEALLSQLPLEPSSCEGQPVIPCSEVPNLPALVISFTSGHSITLKGADYIYETKLPWCREPVIECMPLIDSIPENIPDFEFPSNLIILGSAFLKSAYTVFDWDERKVGFGNLKA